MKIPRTTLEQWRVLQAVVDSGSFAQAAELLRRSQSAVSYAVARLQEQLGTPLLEPDGRRMKLTEAGADLLRDAKSLVESLLKLEQRAQALEQGWEPEVRLAVDTLWPTPVLLEALARFAQSCTNTRVQVVVRDTGTRAPRDSGWLGAAQRWTVSASETAIAMIERGLAYAWVPRHRIADRLADGRLKPLPLLTGQVRHASLYLILADPSAAGPGARHLAECVKQVAAQPH